MIGPNEKVNIELEFVLMLFPTKYALQVSFFNLFFLVGQRDLFIFELLILRELHNIRELS